MFVAGHGSPFPSASVGEPKVPLPTSTQLHRVRMVSNEAIVCTPRHPGVRWGAGAWGAGAVVMRLLPSPGCRWSITARTPASSAARGGFSPGVYSFVQGKPIRLLDLDDIVRLQEGLGPDTGEPGK